jgi:hypothetical protein
MLLPECIRSALFEIMYEAAKGGIRSSPLHQVVQVIGHEAICPYEKTVGLGSRKEKRTDRLHLFALGETLLALMGCESQ